MSMLNTLMLVDAIEKDEGGWITINGRHIFIGSTASAKASKAAYQQLKAESFNSKLSPQEKGSLNVQAYNHSEQVDLLRGSKSSSQSSSQESTPKLSVEDKKLMNVASKAGQKLYGTTSSGLVLDKTKVERGSVKGYLGDADSGKTYDTFDYVFKPSTGKGYDVADDPIRASHADVDGKIYVAGANGVYVINSTKGLPK